MKFQAAYSYLKNGRDITLPEWGGFWRWNAEGQTIHMHTRAGKILDIRKSDNMDYTLSFTFRDDWQLVPPEATTEHDRSAKARPAKAPEPVTSSPLPDWLTQPTDKAPGVWGGMVELCPRCGQHHMVNTACPTFSLSV